MILVLLVPFSLEKVKEIVLSKSNALVQEPCFAGKILQMLGYKACTESLLSCRSTSFSDVFRAPFSVWQARAVLGGCAIAPLQFTSDQWHGLTLL